MLDLPWTHNMKWKFIIYFYVTSLLTLYLLLDSYLHTFPVKGVSLPLSWIYISSCRGVHASSAANYVSRSLLLILTVYSVHSWTCTYTMSEGIFYHIGHHLGRRSIPWELLGFLYGVAIIIVLAARIASWPHLFLSWLIFLPKWHIILKLLHYIVPLPAGIFLDHEQLSVDQNNTTRGQLCWSARVCC